MKNQLFEDDTKELSDIFPQVSNDSDKSNTRDCLIYYLCGNQCASCILFLKSGNINHPAAEIVALKSRSQLIYPNTFLFEFLSIVEHSFGKFCMNYVFEKVMCSCTCRYEGCSCTDERRRFRPGPPESSAARSKVSVSPKKIVFLPGESDPDRTIPRLRRHMKEIACVAPYRYNPVQCPVLVEDITEKNFNFKYSCREHKVDIACEIIVYYLKMKIRQFSYPENLKQKKEKDF
ncbi:hypothetical protein AGLY_009669 [Aphis glycines]|uniref:Uncharacterized protein n=1 Tax=Aphis glycines TaxID=307491 RepID=A0A6G0TIQ9_APHGL|nr:hypothetical protein AGLY_009669 [Aphis glycines]